MPRSGSRSITERFYQRCCAHVRPPSAIRDTVRPVRAPTAALLCAVVAASAVVAAPGPLAASGSKDVDTNPHRDSVEFVGAGNVRVFDSRETGTRLAGGTTHRIDASAVGAPSDAIAVALNVAALDVDANSWVTVFDCAAGEVPGTATVNVVPGETRANNVIVPTTAAGEICVRSRVDVHLVIDAAGYLPSTSSFRPQRPRRVVDSRLPGPIDRLAARSITLIPLPSAVPFDARALALNIAAVGADGPGHFSIVPCSDEVPDDRTAVQTFARDVRSIGMLVEIPDGALGFCLFTSTATDVVVDLNGYVGADSGWVFGQNFEFGNRRLDTRDVGERPLQPFESRPVEWLRRDGMEPEHAPDVAVLTLTVVEPTTRGWAAAYPCSDVRPPTASLNFRVAETTSNTVIVPRGDRGDICLISNTTTDVVVDYVADLQSFDLPLATIPTFTCGGGGFQVHEGDVAGNLGDDTIVIGGDGVYTVRWESSDDVRIDVSDAGRLLAVADDPLAPPVAIPVTVADGSGRTMSFVLTTPDDNPGPFC